MLPASDEKENTSTATREATCETINLMVVTFFIAISQIVTPSECKKIESFQDSRSD